MYDDQVSFRYRLAAATCLFVAYPILIFSSCFSAPAMRGSIIYVCESNTVYKETNQFNQAEENGNMDVNIL